MIDRPLVALAVAGLVVFGLVQFVRPEVTPGSEDFQSSSAAQRIVLGAAGLEIFEQNPVIGAGWRQSSDPNVIGDREIAAEVRGASRMRAASSIRTSRLRASTTRTSRSSPTSD